MGYYPIPDIPDDIDPSARRFCEQVRTALQRIDAYGQPIEVHQPFYAEPESVNLPDTWLDEFPVYRADRPVELLYATWTVEFNGGVEFDYRLRWGPGDAPTTRILLQEIAAASVVTTDWKAFVPKRFVEVTRGRKLLPGHILTLQITGAVEAPDHRPRGLLSMYFRGAVS